MDIEKNVIALRIRYSGKVSYLTIQKPIILIGSLATTAFAVLKAGGGLTGQQLLFPESISRVNFLVLVLVKVYLVKLSLCLVLDF